MNKFLSIIGVSTLLLTLSCQNNDVPGPVPAKPHAQVYPKDLVKIEDYLKSHYVVVQKDANGDVTNVEIDSVDVDHPVSIWDQTDYPLMSKIVKLHKVDYKVYFLKFDGKDDTDAEGEKPCGVDKVLVTYRGTLLNGTQFDYSPNPIDFNLVEVVKGWEHIMQEFRGGYFDATGGDGVLVPRNYGSGAMFLPSGLGYYNGGFGNIPSYAPLVFTFNLLDVTYLDQDKDGIESRYEYILSAEDGTLLDTDKDKIPNVFDADDDNDGYLTKNEIKYTSGGNTYYYPFNGAAADDPSTPLVDETKGIPACGDTDFTSTSRIRKHLDKTCH